MTTAGTNIGVPDAISRSSRSAIRGRRPLIAKITTSVSRQNMRSIERNLVVARARGVLRQAFGQKLAGAGGGQLRAPRLDVERRLLERLQDNFVADPAHTHLAARQAKFLWQAHRLASPMHKDFGCRNHSRPTHF